MSGSDNPVGSIYEGAVAHHEMYLSWIKAGFTKAVIEAALGGSTNG